MDYVVVVDVDGCLYGMWSDDLIGLYEVEQGGVEVERASHVEFCHGCNSWHVWEADQQEYMAMQSEKVYFFHDFPGDPIEFKTREAALQWEREEINRRLIEGVQK